MTEGRGGGQFLSQCRVCSGVMACWGCIRMCMLIVVVVVVVVVAVVVEETEDASGKVKESFESRPRLAAEQREAPCSGLAQRRCTLASCRACAL